jgi:predicted RecB family nuclease
VVVPEDLKIPRFLKVSCRPEDNDLEMVRKKLRKNQVFHMEFNPSLENNEGQRYFADVYIPNQPEEVQPKDSSSRKRKGFLDFIIKERGFSNMIQKGE